MTVQEYNEVFLRKIDNANSFVLNLEHAMQKTDCYEEAMKQLECIGWSDELKETIHTALEFYRKSVLENEVESDTVKKKTPMMAYFELQDWLSGNAKDKPVEVKSAMIWGALSVLHYSGAINWGTMQKMYGEYMSFAMEVR